MAAGYPGPSEALERYEALVAARPDMDRKGAKMPYTSRNGHMCSFLDADGDIGLRLSPEDRQAFIDRYGTGLAEQYGRTMKEFVVVPDDLADRKEELLEWFDRGWEWVGTLKPK